MAFTISTRPTDLTSLSESELDAFEESRKQLKQTLPSRATLSGPNIAPIESREGPDFHVSAARAQRRVEKARRIGEVPGATARMSAYDVNRLESTNAGTTLQPQTPGIDAYRRQNPAQPAQSPADYQAAMRARVKATADAYRSSMAGPSVTAMPPRSVKERADSIGQTLQPGEFVGISEGQNAASAEVGKDGAYRLSSATRPTPPPNIVGRGMVRNPSGQMVPIGAETARIAKPLEAARTRMDQAATSQASYLNRIRDENPAVKTANAVSAYQASQARRYASPAPVNDPYRSTVANAGRQPRARQIRGATFGS